MSQSAVTGLAKTMRWNGKQIPVLHSFPVAQKILSDISTTAFLHLKYLESGSKAP